LTKSKTSAHEGRSGKADRPPQHVGASDPLMAPSEYRRKEQHTMGEPGPSKGIRATIENGDSEKIKFIPTQQA